MKNRHSKSGPKKGDAKGAKKAPKKAYVTKNGVAFQGTVEAFLHSEYAKTYSGKINLIFTSPPFPLNRKKKYGNEKGEAYVRWFAKFAPLFSKLLTPRGSIVVELGNAWEPGLPVMSTLALRSLLRFLSKGKLHLCQQFVCYNPARLPSPAAWVSIKRIRVKDSFTHLWWMSPSTRPKASNRRVLTGYSDSMKKLLKRGKYNSGPRPSQHHIGEKSFLRNNGGAIPSNVLIAANTRTGDKYQTYCKKKGLDPHPARMPEQVPSFFIRFLTEKGDRVFDPFAGSNTTGAVAERLKRKWVAVEARADYLKASQGRFEKLGKDSNGRTTTSSKKSKK